MIKYFGAALDFIWNLRFFEGKRHQIFRWAGIAATAYQVLATDPKSPLVQLPDIPVLWFGAFIAWLSTKGIQFAKEHRPD